MALITRLATVVALSLIDRGFSINPDLLQRFPGLEVRANRYLPLLRRIVASAIAVVGFVAVLEVWGVDAIVWFYGGQIGSRLLSAAVTIGIAAVAAAAIWEASNALLDRQLNMLAREGHYARAARLRTFQPMLRTVTYAIWGQGFGDVEWRSGSFNGADIGPNCQLRYCVLGAGARVGANTHIEGGAVLGEGVTIGADNILTHGARIFPGVSLPDGAIRF